MVVQKPHFFSRRRLLLGCFVLVILYSVLMTVLPLPQVKVEMKVAPGKLETGQLAPIMWPDSLQAAVGTQDLGLLASSGTDKAIPIASVAKVITALAVIKQKPLRLGDTGPVLTLTSEDVDLYKSYLASGGSVTPVTEGQQINEYQALQMMLLPSSNNMASTLSRWAFGSDQAYVDFANKMVKDMGLTKTHIADASGFSPQTVSTAHELVLLGQEFSKHPVLAQIVNQKQATIPGFGLLSNTNDDLGVADINGIKTGTTPEAGGCLLFSATRQVGDQPVQVIGVVMGANNREAALSAAPELVDASFARLSQVVPIKASQVVATIRPAWSSEVDVQAQQDLKQVVWQGSTIPLQLHVWPGVSGKVGEAALNDAKIPLQLAHTVPEASIFWRLTHPFDLVYTFFKR